MCRVLGVSTSGYYAWQKRQPSHRDVEDGELTCKIQAIHARSDGTYGAPRIHAELQEDGVYVGQKRVARLMRQAHLRGVCRRKWITTTTRADEDTIATDLVKRNFTASEKNRLWVADITYVPTWEGFLYLAVVLDAYSRRIVGWAMADHLQTGLVIDALDMAIWNRNPVDVIHHSDHGSQYTSIAFGNRCTKAGVRPSLGSVGDCFDNAMCESFFASLECELIDRRRFATRKQARQEIFQYIEAWYNLNRRHSAIGYQSPINYENRGLEACKIQA